MLPNRMNYIQEAGFLEAVNSYGFQYKNGAAFSWNDEYRYFDFCDKTTSRHGTTFQVVRGEFDKILIDEAIKQGVLVDFGIEAKGIEFKPECVLTTLSNGELVRSKYIVDASGYSRVLPSMLGLEVKSHLSPKKAYFTHIADKISEPLYDRNKILITTHPEYRNVWFWLIPFSNGRCSIGVVGEDEYIKCKGLDELETLKNMFIRHPC
ncbi:MULTISPECIES: NAD(P)/FAD-dependent oxidoreductase [unclassified Campylobacter]|uniref:NAD(P)/FAD-dependent oxidoreductase n=1 Tax=unclassified Campylobacter TaxID=2593542 RepID=UPI003D3324AE